MIVDGKIENYFFELKKYIENYRTDIKIKTLYNKIKNSMKLLGYNEVSFNNSYLKNINIYVIKYHKFINTFKEDCTENIINVTIFDNDNTNKLSLSVNYTEITTTQKTLF